MWPCKLCPSLLTVYCPSSPVELETLHIGQREILLGGLSTGTYGCTGTIKGVHSYQKIKWCLRIWGHGSLDFSLRRQTYFLFLCGANNLAASVEPRILQRVGWECQSRKWSRLSAVSKSYPAWKGDLIWLLEGEFWVCWWDYLKCT